MQSRNLLRAIGSLLQHRTVSLTSPVSFDPVSDGHIHITYADFAFLDPVFFLHHTQVDRLWWIWQNRDPQTRLKEFHGPAENFKHHDHGDLVSTSSKTDLLPMAGLVGDTSVDDVMDTVGGYLCYVY